MWAHEWTRARQRSVRREDATPLTTSSEPSAEVEPIPRGEDAVEQPGLAPEATVVPDVHSDSPATVEEPAEPEPPAPVTVTAQTAPPPTADVTPPPPPPPTRHRPRRRTARSVARQAELPLGLEPVPETSGRRSVTETREELIERLLDPHLTLQETAKLLDVCPTTIRRYTNRGLLAHYRTPGNQRRFRLSDVLAFMERQGIPARGLERRRAGLLEEPTETIESNS